VEAFNYDHITHCVRQGWTIKATHLTEEFDYGAFRRQYNGALIPMFLIEENKRLLPFITDMELEPKPGETIIALVNQS